MAQLEPVLPGRCPGHPPSCIHIWGSQPFPLIPYFATSRGRQWSKLGSEFPSTLTAPPQKRAGPASPKKELKLFSTTNMPAQATRWEDHRGGGNDGKGHDPLTSRTAPLLCWDKTCIPPARSLGPEYGPVLPKAWRPGSSFSIFLTFMYVFIWLPQVLVVSCGIFPCGVRTLAVVQASVVAMRRLSCSMARGTLALRSGIEPVFPASQGRSLTTGPPGKSQPRSSCQFIPWSQREDLRALP